jgi:hypothetical protein
MIRRIVLSLLSSCLLALALLPPSALAAPSEQPLQVVPGSFQILPSTMQAGAHEDLITSFEFAHTGAGPSFRTLNDVKDTVVNLPPGFLGNNTAVPTCPVAKLLGKNVKTGAECPPDTQVGTISFELTLSPEPVKLTFPVYNVQVTASGITAELGFNAIILTQTLTVSVRPGDLGLTVAANNIEQTGEVHNVSVTIWGVPGAKTHDAERGRQCYPQPLNTTNVECIGGGDSVDIAPKPFLSTPTACNGPQRATIKADSWEQPGAWSEESTEVAPIVECERVHFDPSIAATPTTNAAESPTGLNFSMEVPQTWENPQTISTANLKDAFVTLPEGMSLNPSAGSGLGSCTEAQLARETASSPPGAGCPPESKVGSVEVETPVLTEHATGAVYVAKPFDNPFHSLLALYIVAKVPARGIVATVAGEVHPNPLTGQLTTTFDENPQVPFNRFTLRFNQGATSPLISPPVCGTYTALADLTPWSAPLSPQHLSASFPLETGVHGGPCPSGGTPPFHPLLHAGSYSNQAGAYSPFYIRLSREDGEQEITHFSIKLPPGLIGKLAGIPVCSDAAIAAAKARSGPHGGQEEQERPSCLAASEVGRTEVEAGVGTTLASAPGKVYLAGPYHGAQLSVAAITAAKVGPFDLGTVVVREGLKVNPETGEVFVDSVGSDPLPHIIQGIPTHLRNIRVYMDRPEFVLNPTSCQKTSTASTVLGSGKDFASEVDDRPITVSSFFQAANCAALPFKPKLKLSLKGATKRSGTPAFRAELTMKPGEANIAKSVVTLPHSEFLDNAHIQTVCTRPQFAANQCPKGSVYGYARAITPILSDPLEGPVYLRSNGGERNLPDLVAALHGAEINIDLVGHIDSVNGRIRNTFETVPDAPVTKFVLSMNGGNKGLLENSTNLCAKPNRAIVNFTGQNGKLHNFNPVLAVKCGKKGGKHHQRHRRHHG